SLYVDPGYPDVYPKDFAFFWNVVPTGNPAQPWRRLFHLIYIRARHSTDADSLAHTWSEDLVHWSPPEITFPPSGSGWDGGHAWAPSIVQVGNLYYMFYTGVDAVNVATGNQSIGYTTTTLLGTTNIVWQPGTMVYQAANTGWSNQQAPPLQFRDPWVMLDPDNAGRYLLFNVGADNNSLAHTVVGVARNNVGTLDSWTDLGPYPATDYGHTGITRGESPLVIHSPTPSGSWRILLTNGEYTDGGADATYIIKQTAGLSVTDRDPAHWPGIQTLYDYLMSNSSFLAWAASEYMQIGKAYFLAGYNGNGIAITRMQWVGDTFVVTYPSLAAVEPAATVTAFFVAGLHPGTSSARFVIGSPELVTPQVTLYDVAGRRLQTLRTDQPFRGRAEMTWDGRDTDGHLVASGVYFARLTGAGPARVVRVPIIR
ncbi:MAG: FlgD immunoglobulin-like domain containing protein, partial [Candidatus Eisenbacteria bacterium]